ncbi:uncharacterized protein LOC103575444 [Microplitis demolitor]|uniref:uncharacterized protein LOC103575444 n=1 Tax=Microplitis demolitor TaxID=69319 RepID=UPI0004CD00FD|nr:uncharacterized protein LOC103575444 [Microplitis demolitor]
MASKDDGYWVTPLFREGMIIKIDEVMQKSCGVALLSTSTKTEDLIFSQSTSKDEYSKFIDLLITCIEKKNFDEITEPCGSLSLNGTVDFIKNMIYVHDFYDIQNFIDNVPAIPSSSHNSATETLEIQENNIPKNSDQPTVTNGTNYKNTNSVSKLSTDSSDDDDFQFYSQKSPAIINTRTTTEPSPSKSDQNDKNRKPDQENIEDLSTQIEIEEIELIDPGDEPSQEVHQQNPINAIGEERGIMEFMAQKLDSIENTMKLYTDDLGQIIIHNINGNVNIKFDEYKNSLDTVRRKLDKQTKRLDRIEKELKLRYLVIYGVAENERNSRQLEKTIVNIINKEVKVNLDPSEIDSVRRIGKDIKKPRPVVLGLTTLRKKMLIMRKRKLLKYSKVSIENDFVQNSEQSRRGKDLSLLL